MTTLTLMNKKDIQTILSSQLFNAEFYLTSYPDVKNSGIDPIIHYVLFGCHENKNPNDTFNTQTYKNLFQSTFEKDENPFAHYLRHNENLYFFEKGLLQNNSHEVLLNCLNKIKKYPYFNPEYYQAANPNIKFEGISATRHALLYGIGEGRTVLSPRHIAQHLGWECKQQLTYTPAKPSGKAVLPESVGVFYHSEGNIFIQELAGILCNYIKRSKINVQLMTEKTPVSERPELCIFCAPHEFFFLSGSEHWKNEDILTSSIMFNTEQPHTLWFTRGLIYCLMSAGVIDICHQNMASFKNTGLNVFHFDPLPVVKKTTLTQTEKKHPFFRVLSEETKNSSSPLCPLEERPLDISFFGNTSGNRERFFSHNTEFFTEYSCFLYYRKTDGPLTHSDKYSVPANFPRYIAERSKIALNIHRDDFGFFEWHRLVQQNMASGAVVVTEECFPHPLYKNGTHYLSESARHIPNLIEWLLNTDDGMTEAARIQKNCFRVFANKSLALSKLNDIRSYLASVWSTVQ
ncbi:hypothetical protein JK183_04495 [Acetobacter thailandicus]|nr:hypothetical protein [Acetobacter thailandicus]